MNTRNGVSAWCIDHPIATLLLTFALVLLGAEREFEGAWGEYGQDVAGTHWVEGEGGSPPRPTHRAVLQHLL